MKPVPLHERIRSELEAAILSGELAPGERLPFESELMARYGCSRMTVSKALGTLAQRGLIARRRRAGSFVTRPRVHSMVLDIPDLAAEVQARGDIHRFELLKHAGTGDRLVLRGRHFTNDRVLALEERLINLAAVPAIAGIDFAVLSPGAWLLQHVPWTEAESRISAVPAAPTDAAALDVAAGTACLKIDRATWRGEDWITQVTQLFPGDGYDLLARFGPDRAQSGDHGHSHSILCDFPTH